MALLNELRNAMTNNPQAVADEVIRVLAITMRERPSEFADIAIRTMAMAMRERPPQYADEVIRALLIAMETRAGAFADAVIGTIADSVHNYPLGSVAIGIINLTNVPPSTPGAINVNEVWKFQVRVSNNGHLSLTNVYLEVEGLNGVMVSTDSNGVWGPLHAQVAGTGLTVAAHGSQDTRDYYLRAPNAPLPAGTQLIASRIRHFDAFLDHVLIGHSGRSDQPVGIHVDQVYP